MSAEWMARQFAKLRFNINSHRKCAVLPECSILFARMLRYYYSSGEFLNMINSNQPTVDIDVKTIATRFKCAFNYG